jgi:excisionase family DNA binding protein
MEDLITTKQLQELLQVDRTTIYRMLGDGRLQGIRVGGQWRFPRAALEECLINAKPAQQMAAEEHTALVADVLPLSCVEPIQDVFATAADVGSITTDHQGKPLTVFSNSCPFCDLVLASPEGRKRCEASWKKVADSTSSRPKIEVCHAGLSYAPGRIQVEDEFVAMIFAGQFVANVSERDALKLDELALECQIPLAKLQEAARQIRTIDAGRAEWLLKLLNKVADTFSHIGQQRLDLLKRLRQVAELAQV